MVQETQFNLDGETTGTLNGANLYHLMFWPNVARAAAQIDPAINTNQLPPPINPLTGSDRPAPVNTTSTLWIQVVTVGLDFRF